MASTVKTITVEHGYVLTDSDYPTVPAKTGYSGAWEKYTEPVTQDVTVEAVYTINKYTVKFVANGVTVKNMTVNYGYTLKTSDYPAVPVVGGKTGEWIRYTRPITRNITITARYSDAGINPPVKPPIETSSIDGAASNNGTVKETVTAHHSYIYTAGRLAQESITTTVTPADGTVASATDTISATTSGTISATASDSVAAIASNSTTTTETLYYAYDANGVPMSLTYTDTDGASATYYYATNIQGDVTAILDTTGIPVVEYTYDAWGNSLTVTGTLADTLGELNSLRYRGYVYDTETSLYYLQSRYYNPKMGRFINADGLISIDQDIIAYNIFSYCSNNSIIFRDPKGARMVAATWFGGGVPTPKNRNIANMVLFFGVDSADDVPALEDNCMVFVENTTSVTIMGTSYIRGKTVVMDADKYCEYAFWGVGKGVSALPLDNSVTKGYVYNVKNPSDYSGLFGGTSANMIWDVKGGAYALNGVYAELISGTSYTGASVGISLTYYVQLQTEWTYAKANVTTIASPYAYFHYPWNDPRV